MSMSGGVVNIGLMGLGTVGGGVAAAGRERADTGIFLV